MILKVIPLSQRDDRWKAKKLGNSLLTLGTSGCLVTCLTMVARYYGKDIYPDKLNEELLRVTGFALDKATGKLDLYIWGSINKIYGDISEPKRVETPKPVNSAQWAEIEKELEAGRPVIAKVDFIPSTASVDMHFVIIVGKDENGNWLIIDPWFGDVSTLQRYGKPEVTIQMYIFTSGNIPTQPTTQPTEDQSLAISVLTKGWKDLPEDDVLKKGNMEGFVRELLEQHKHYADYEKKSKQFDAFIEKWFAEWRIKEDPNKSHQVSLEEEMTKHLKTEDDRDTFRLAIEAIVGEFENDEALLKALSAIKDDKQTLADQVDILTKQIKDLKTKQGVKYSFSIFGFPVKIYEKEGGKK